MDDCVRRRWRAAMWVAALGVSLGGASVGWAGPYAGAAGSVGPPASTAMDKSDPAFIAWATGWTDYQVGGYVDAAWMTPAKALGAATDDVYDVVVLGRGGRITMTFDHPIADGAGDDFAVFENGVTDYFLELAWVEVSANGQDFFRFPNDSLTPGAVSAYGMLDATNVDGLAGKYRVGYGLPFDLASVGLAQASYVRLIDIVGDGSALDTSGDVIYDPYPTTGSAGFDLEAIGVLHQWVVLPGDLNGDGTINNLDIAPFILGLADAGGYAEAFPGIDLNDAGDINADGAVNNLDIGPFISLLAGGSGQAVPEPASVGVMASVWVLMLRRRG